MKEVYEKPVFDVKALPGAPSLVRDRDRDRERVKVKR